MKEKTKKKVTKPKSKQQRSIYTCPHCRKKFDNSSNWHSHIKLHSTEEPYHCELCNYKCKVKKYLTRHIRSTHTKPTGHQCPVCGKCFHFDCALKSHMRVHTGEKPYRCNLCDKAFSSSYSLGGHKLIHTGEKPFQCEYCDYACRDSSTIRKHVEKHLGVSKNYPCSICNKNFKKRQTLQIHVDEVHFQLDARKYPCELCEKAFKTKASRTFHVRTVHKKTNRVKCEICGILTTKNNLQAHMRRHIDVRPYKCSYKPCSKRFKDKGDLRRHQVIHYPEFQHVCTVCNRRFPRKFRLDKHMLNGCRRVQCHHCGQLFSAKKFLAQHIKNAHGPYPKSREYLCDVCDMVTYSRRGIIQHLKYGHGTEKDTMCQICNKDYFKYLTLKEHYLSNHNLKYCLLENKEHNTSNFNSSRENNTVAIKEEQIEETEEIVDSSEFMYEVDIQKHEIDEIPFLHPTSPEHYDIDVDTITYSKKVLSEDISRSLIERDRKQDEFDDFFIGNALKKPDPVIDLPKQIVDKRRKETVEKQLDKLLASVRIRNQYTALEKLRRQYNRRIKMATSCGKKQEPKPSIRFFKKPANNDEVTKSQNDSNNEKDINIDNDKTIDQAIDDVSRQRIDSVTNNNIENPNDDEPIDDESNSNKNTNINDDETNDQETVQISEQKIDTEIIENSEKAGNDEPIDDEKDSDEINGVNNDETNNREIDEISKRKENIDSETKENSDKSDDEDDEPIDDGKDSDYKDSDEEINPNGKLTFNTHQCYVCFKLFKTKTDLKRHCQQHFDICNEKMLKKCPFCGYVTNSTIKRHIKLVHKISITIPYGRVKERDTQNGSKYVFEIDKDCDLEIIPSISNLNKIAAMKIDEKNRDAKNAFLGTTKLVKRGDDWMIEKQKVDVDSQYLLPEFAEEDYKALKSAGDTYLEKIRSLSIVAKKKGFKILYPCDGCDKICLTMSALKLHSRKHEANPKRFKPKVWKNKILNGIGGRYSHVNKNNNKKKYGNKYKNGADSKNGGKVNDVSNKKQNGVKKSSKLEIDSKKENGAAEAIANRFAAPNPVKNKHKCDKQLIDFYKNNIKGGDIEFWQFLKIFNKMSRENVNDFKDLENRHDFGMHKIVNYDASNTENTTESAKDVIIDTAQAAPKKNLKRKKKAFTRAIMISKKEYKRRLEIKNQMRLRLEQSKS